MNVDKKTVHADISVGDKVIRKKYYWHEDHHDEDRIKLNKATNYLSAYMTNAGEPDMAVNGGTPVTYSYTVPEGSTVEIHRLLLAIEHGTVAFVSGHFGALGAALTNGVEISVTNSGVTTILETWKTNRQVRDTMFDFDQAFKTNGAYTGRWTFTKDLNAVGIELKSGDSFQVKIQDDLSSLDYLSMRLKGNIS